MATTTTDKLSAAFETISVAAKVEITGFEDRINAHIDAANAALEAYPAPSSDPVRAALQQEVSTLQSLKSMQLYTLKNAYGMNPVPVMPTPMPQA